MKKSINVLVLLLGIGIISIPAQEALKSAEEEYYDFLSLQGLAERPYLNYRTLSDSVWDIAPDAEHPWQGQNLGTKRNLFGDVFMKIYGPGLFNSFNTAAPYGQNDGALWQGRGFNTSLTGGIRIEGYGVELTFKPQLAFSQNTAFDIINQTQYDSEYGYFWGYNHNAGVDAPQRFGGDSFFTYDWGDSEVRYTWKTLTIGFGTQAIWLGPAYLNPILHSNNAPTYPKLDIGLRKQRVVIPWVNWYLGDVEARLWVGYLSESDYFDNDDSNDHNMFHGLSLAYAPSFLPGLTLSANRVCLVPWEWENLKYIWPMDNNTIEDQKASFALSWLFPQVGFEIFGELGIDDFVSGKGIIDYIRHPFHTTVYTVGLKKFVNIVPKKQIYGEILFESNWMEMTQDFQLQWTYSCYFHHLITQGYTNKGQWLGNGLGSGGNSQYLAFKVYYPRGSSAIFIHRNNPDNNYVWSQAVENTAGGGNLSVLYYKTMKTSLVIGVSTEYKITPDLAVSGAFAYDLLINPLFKTTANRDNVLLHNFNLQLGIKYVL